MRYFWPRQRFIQGCVRRCFEELIKRSLGVEGGRDAKHVLKRCDTCLLEATKRGDSDAGAGRKLFLTKASQKPEMARSLPEGVQGLSKGTSIIDHSWHIIAIFWR